MIKVGYMEVPKTNNVGNTCANSRNQLSAAATDRFNNIVRKAAELTLSDSGKLMRMESSTIKDKEQITTVNDSTRIFTTGKELSIFYVDLGQEDPKKASAYLHIHFSSPLNRGFEDVFSAVIFGDTSKSFHFEVLNNRDERSPRDVACGIESIWVQKLNEAHAQIFDRLSITEEAGQSQSRITRSSLEGRSALTSFRFARRMV
jgi:hypothetical protein